MHPEAGDKVILIGLPLHFLNDLSLEGQKDIRNAIGKPVLLNGYDEDGLAELIFCEISEVSHTIYVGREFFRSTAQDDCVELSQALNLVRMARCDVLCALP